jgi:hypothetical protein
MHSNDMTYYPQEPPYAPQQPSYQYPQWLQRDPYSQTSNESTGANMYPQPGPGQTNQFPQVPNSMMQNAQTRVPITGVHPYQFTGAQKTKRSPNLQVHIGVNQNKHMHVLYIGIGIIAGLLLFVGIASITSWGSQEWDTIQYGMPRTYQTDAVVQQGGDSTAHPSHFIVTNFKGQIVIMEYIAGNPNNEKTYLGPQLTNSDGYLVPVTLSFTPATKGGKPDMIVHIQDRTFTFTNDGTQFKPQPLS